MANGDLGFEEHRKAVIYTYTYTCNCGRFELDSDGFLISAATAQAADPVCGRQS